jgi:hypothetical protein
MGYHQELLGPEKRMIYCRAGRNAQDPNGRCQRQKKTHDDFQKMVDATGFHERMDRFEDLG